jgi:hypothetical protein
VTSTELVSAYACAGIITAGSSSGRCAASSSAKARQDRDVRIMIDKNKDTIFLAIVLPPPKEYLRIFHSAVFDCNLIMCCAQEKK